MLILRVKIQESLLQQHFWRRISVAKTEILQRVPHFEPILANELSLLLSYLLWIIFGIPYLTLYMVGLRTVTLTDFISSDCGLSFNVLTTHLIKIMSFRMSIIPPVITSTWQNSCQVISSCSQRRGWVHSRPIPLGLPNHELTAESETLFSGQLGIRLTQGE